MNYFDLHCDTIYECYVQSCGLSDNQLQLDFKRLSEFETAAQVFAVWLDDSFKGQQATDRFLELYQLYKAETLQKSHVRSILSIENGCALGGDIANVKRFSELGVKLMTLVWNGKNELGSGANEQGGITAFGKAVIREMERLSMIVDVSHLNDEGFYDVAGYVKRPFIATHSNARSICNHKRNLSDEQFIMIRDRGGIVGINLYPLFLNLSEHADFEDIYRHVAHFLSLNGENTIAFGTDFDGAKMSDNWNGVEKMCNIRNYLETRISDNKLLDKLFYENANNFFNHFDKQ